MVKEDIKSIVKTKTIVTRICDSCGKEEKRTLREILVSANRKNLGKDYCKKCCYKYRDNNQKKGSESPFWTNGISLNRTSGYLRINKTGEYLHKHIYGESIGRKISRTEQVHHIDLEKLNNKVNNLFLCDNITIHNGIHYNMENLGYNLLNKFIWFDKQQLKYVLSKCYNEKVIFSVQKKPTCSSKWRNGKIYDFIYISYRKHKAYHRYVMEKFLGRSLIAKEHIHHIDLNTTNNDINNLVLCNRSIHKKIHNSLQFCVADLYKKGLVQFKKGMYYV